MSLQGLLAGGLLALVCPCVFGVHDELRLQYDEPIEVNGFTVERGTGVCIKSLSADQWFEATVVATSTEGGKQLVQIHYSDPQNLPKGAMAKENKKEKAPNNKYHKTINVAGPNKALIKQSCKGEKTAIGGGSASIGNDVVEKISVTKDQKTYEVQETEDEVVKEMIQEMPKKVLETEDEEEVQETEDEVVKEMIQEMPTAEEILSPKTVPETEDEEEVTVQEGETTMEDEGLSPEKIQKADAEMMQEMPTAEEILSPEKVPETEDEEEDQVTVQEGENNVVAAGSCDNDSITVKAVQIIGYILEPDVFEWRHDVYVLAKNESGLYTNPGGPITFINCPEKWEVDELAEKEKGAQAFMGDDFLKRRTKMMDFGPKAKEDIVQSSGSRGLLQTCHVYSLEIEPDTYLETYWASNSIEKVKCQDDVDDMNLEDDFKLAILSSRICIEN